MLAGQSFCFCKLFDNFFVLRITINQLASDRHFKIFIIKSGRNGATHKRIAFYIANGSRKQTVRLDNFLKGFALFDVPAQFCIGIGTILINDMDC